MTRTRGFKRCLALLLTCLAAAGCSRFKVHTIQTPGVPLGGLKNWAWTEGMEGAQSESTTASPFASAIEAELGHKGFTKTTSQAADFRVSFRFQADVRVDARQVNEYPAQVAGWFPAIGGSGFLSESRDGLLRVIVYDPSGHTQWWQGFAATRLAPELSDEDRDKIIRGAVHAVLERFPPR